MEDPVHIEGAGGVMFIIGVGLMVTVTEVVPVQPAEEVPVTV